MFNGDNKHCSSPVVVECAPNVPVAMAIMASRQQQPPFDLIIAEQLPSLPPAPQLTTTCSTIDGFGNVDSTTVSNSLTGADLLFHHLPAEYRDQMLLISVAPSPFSMSLNQNVAQDNNTSPPYVARTNTVTSLSDLVWNKPPPRMDNNLRTQLIRTLQMKRDESKKK